MVSSVQWDAIGAWLGVLGWLAAMAVFLGVELARGLRAPWPEWARRRGERLR